MSLGVKAALWATKMPKIYITGEDGGVLEYSVSDNPRDVDRIDVSNAPILITHLRVSGVRYFVILLDWIGKYIWLQSSGQMSM